MKIHEVRKLERVLTQEFLLTQNQTGLDVLAWYTKSTGPWTRHLREIDSYEDAMTSIRTAAASPNPLSKRLVRAFDAGAVLVNGRGIDLTAELAVLAAMGIRRDVLQTFAEAAEIEVLNSSDGWLFSGTSRRTLTASASGVPLTRAAERYVDRCTQRYASCTARAADAVGT